MQLSQKTKQILKNFSVINPSIYFMEGNVIRTMSPLQTIFARANVEENFTQEFGIYELPRFLSALSLFKTPVLDFKEDFLMITDQLSGAKIRYVYAGKNMVISPYDKDPKYPEENELIKFEFDVELLNATNKALNVMSLDTLFLEGKDGKLILRGENVEDKRSSCNDNYVYELGKTNEKFSLSYKRELLSVLYAENYLVRVTKGKNSYMSWFASNTIDYYLICNKED